MVGLAKRKEHGLTQLPLFGNLEIPLEPFDIDEGAMTGTYIQFGTNAASFTGTDIDGSTQIVNSNGSQTVAFTTGLTLTSADLHVRHTIDVTVNAATYAFGIAINNGVDARTQISFYPSNGNWWVLGKATEAGQVGAALTPIGATPTLVLDCYLRPSDGSMTVLMSIDGGAPYALHLTNTSVEDGATVEIFTYGNSTAVHTFETREISLGTYMGGIGPAMMHTPLGYTARSVPAGLPEGTMPGGLTFYEDGGAYYSSLNLRPVIAPTDYEVATVYVDLAAGSDSNGGTEAAPYKSLHKAANHGRTGGQVIIKAKGGLYPYANCFRNYVPADVLQVQSWDGQPVVSSMHDDTLSWTAASGAYSTTVSGIANIYDHSNLTPLGNPTRLTYAANLAACQATANTYYISGSTLYVHTFDDRAPDADLRVYRYTGVNDRYGIRQTKKGSHFYLDNVKFHGGYDPYQAVGATATDVTYLYAKDCDFSFGAENFSLSGQGPGAILLENCHAAGARQDGFNYRPATNNAGRAHFVVEVNCTGEDNGYDGGGASNGSTTHGGTIIRVGGRHENNTDRNIHDIGWNASSEIGWSWNLGVTAQNPVTASANFAIGNPGAALASLMYLDGCVSAGGGYDIEANAAATAYYDATFSGDATNNTADSGTVTTYDAAV